MALVQPNSAETGLRKTLKLYNNPDIIIKTKKAARTTI